MSDDSPSLSSVLLPESGIDLFYLTDQSRELLEGMQSDWRFDRVKIRPFEGGAQEALDLYQKQASPDLIILETDKIDESFIKSLETLGEHCAQGTNAVVIGPDNDIRLYRKLKEMGVSDYYVHPVSAEDFKTDIIGIITESKGLSEARIFTFIGAKGGVGTSAMAQALALGLSHDLGETTLILDCARGRSYTSIALSDNEPGGTLQEAVRAAMSDDHERLGRLVVSGTIENLYVLSTGGEEILSPLPAPEEFEQLLNFLAGRYDNIIVDLDGADPQTSRQALRISTDIALVTRPDIVSLRAGRALFREILSLRGESAHGALYLINKFGENPPGELDKKDISEAMDNRPAALISYNPKLFAQTLTGETKLYEQESGQQIIKALLGCFHKKDKKNSNSDKSLDKSKKKNSVFGEFINKFTS